MKPITALNSLTSHAKGRIEKVYRLGVESAQLIAQQIVQKEIQALHRIGAARDCGLPSMGGGMWEFDRYFTIELCDDKLTAFVDFYSQSFDSRADDSEVWDDDAYEVEKMHLECTPITPENFAALYRTVRVLLNGKTVSFSDGSVTSRDLHLAQVRAGATA